MSKPVDGLRKLLLQLAIASPFTGLLVLAVVNLWTRPDTHNLITEWQSLIAGLIAIIAALIGGAFIRQQIAASERLERERVERRFRSVRAGLPTVLSAVIDYAEICGAELDRLYSGASPLGVSGPTTLPVLNDEVIPSLREAIEVGDDQLADLLADLLSRLQIFRARLRSLEVSLLASSSTIVLPVNVEERAVDNAELHARASALFPFARRRGPLPERTIRRTDIMGALALTLPWSHTMTSLQTIVDVYYPE
jgi:hypothetical protein